MEKDWQKPKFKPGDRVTFKGREKGRILRVLTFDAWVVYDCEKDWKKYVDHSAIDLVKYATLTDLRDLEKGWK